MATYYSSPGEEDEQEQVSSYHPSLAGNFLYMNNSPYSEFGGMIQQQQRDPELAVPGMRGDMFIHMNAGGDVVQGDQLQQFSFVNGHGASLHPANALSLSLNSQVAVASYPYWAVKPESMAMSSYQEGADMKPVQQQSDFSRAIRNSKFLKAAQDLLDEVVNVWKAIKQRTQNAASSGAAAAESKDDNHPESEASQAKELPQAEKQELQNKLGKLLAMLDEVDRRYKHYYHQMQNIVSSFDVVAGAGSAKPYTAVALQTISRHFRCLKDAINEQIRTIRRKLGEEESSGKEGRLTRLRYIDQQLRQQRAFQQYGMIQQNAWRPQRGLPENSVSILRAWLFEHFLHPYPKDSEKLMLSRQTGLTRSQISNWFINARVRLWKPMIEDMYKEELGDMEIDSNSSSDNAPRIKDRQPSPEPGKEEPRGSASAHQHYPGGNDDDGGLHVGAAMCFPGDVAPVDDSFMSLMLKAQAQHPAAGAGAAALFQEPPSSRFVAYHQQLMGGRHGKGSVSLTLGLQQHSGAAAAGSLLLPNAAAGEDQFLPGPATGGDLLGAAGEEYDAMEQRQRFEPSPLLHDFVA